MSRCGGEGVGFVGGEGCHGAEEVGILHFFIFFYFCFLFFVFEMVYVR